MSNYPKNYEFKETPSDYMKFELGQNKVRILAPVILGFESWENKHPIRYKTFDEIVADPKANKIKEFHAFIVWDYKTEMVRLLNVTQKGIQKSIYNQTLDDDWSNFTEYDIVITRTGTTMDDTEYAVVFKLPKPITEEINKAFKEVTIKPDEYFNDGHPIVREQPDAIKNAEEALVGNEDDSAEDVADAVPF